jgi:hypothetical protein
MLSVKVTRSVAEAPAGGAATAGEAIARPIRSQEASWADRESPQVKALEICISARLRYQGLTGTK